MQPNSEHSFNQSLDEFTSQFKDFSKAEIMKLLEADGNLFEEKLLDNLCFWIASKNKHQ